MVEISAKTGLGVNQLLEIIDLVCEMEDCRGNPDTSAEMVVMEAKRSTQEGTIVHALVQEGTLHHGDYVFLPDGLEPIRITRLHDETHTAIQTAGPSTPISFLGCKDLPSVGTLIIGTKDKTEAMTISEMRKRKEHFKHKIELALRMKRERELKEKKTKKKKKRSKNENEDDNFTSPFTWLSTQDPKTLNIWIRADCWGSIEALEKYLQEIKIPNDDFHFYIFNKDVGPVTEELIREIDHKNCFILAFNTYVDKPKQALKHVKIFQHNIIFHLFHDFI
ncbi:hypothetical protein RFI_22070, partial [Reticulomyxa filosa]